MANNSPKTADTWQPKSESKFDINHGSVYTLHRNYNDMDADPLTDFIHWILVFIFIPCVSILGVIGNSLSIIILAKRGLQKSSNILLFSLAISDIVFMLGVNGPPKTMYEWGGGGFQYSEVRAMILYYLYNFFDSLNWGSGPTSLCIPVLITIERLIAVFLPLKFNSLVTRRRTITAVIVTNVLFYGLQVYVRSWFQFVYMFDNTRNVSVGYSARSDIYVYHREVSEVIEICFNSMIVLVMFVGGGCVAIGIKIKVATIKRQKMTSLSHGDHLINADRGTSRTTKMLLCLCVFYAVVCAPISLPGFLPGLMVFPVFEENPNFRSVGVFVYHVYKLIFCINASCNFIIYVAMSKNFRDTLLDLLHIRPRRQLSSSVTSKSCSDALAVD